MDQDQTLEFRDAVKNILKNGKLRECVCQDTALSFLSKGDSERLRWWPAGLIDCRFPVILASEPKDGGVLPDEDSVIENGVSESNEESFVSVDSPKHQPKQHKPSSGDLTGSPLKLQAFADFSIFGSPKHSTSSTTYTTPKLTTNTPVGIPLSKARLLVSMASMSLKELQSNRKDESKMCTPSFLVLCDGTDKKRTACIYIEPLFTEDNKLIGSKISSICVKDPTNDNSHLPKLDCLNLSGKQVQCEASYSVVDSNRDDGRPQNGYQGSLLLEAKWNKLTKQLQPPLDARTLVKAHVSSGDMRSAAYVLYKELSFLRSLVTGVFNLWMTYLLR